MPQANGARATGTPADAPASRNDFRERNHLPDDAARAYAIAGQARERVASLIASMASDPGPAEGRSDPAEKPAASRSEASSSRYADHLGPLRGQAPANGKVLDRAA